MMRGSAWYKVTRRGVMVAILDTGIDYRNPLFRNIDGSTRIAGIWDQTIQDGTLPDGLDYGSEYTEEMINDVWATEWLLKYN